MAYNFSIAVVYLFELLISYIFFNQVSEIKKDKKFTFLIGVICFGLATIVNIAFSTIWLNFVTFFLANCIFSVLCFEMKLKQTVFYSVVLDIVSTATEYITIFVVSVISGEDVAYTIDQYSAFLLNAVICKTLYFFICLLLTRFIKNNEKSSKVPVTFYFYPLAVVAVLLFLWNIYTTYSLSDVSKLSISFISAMLLLSTIILFISYRNNMERENKLLLLEQEIIKADTDKLYYQILEKQNENLMIYAHDTKKHLSAIRNLNDNTQINLYLTKMSENLEEYSKINSSGNHSLDVIISKYVTECEIKNVRFTYDTRLTNLSEIDIYDLVSILGNVLDNALEAAEKSKAKYIQLYTDYRNNFDIIVIKNSCDTEPVSSNNILRTTKTKNTAFHGLGLKSLKKTLKKYKGDYSWEYDKSNKEFTTTIMIQREI